MKNLLLASSLALSLATAALADSFSISSTIGGAPTGATLYNFDDLDLGSGAQSVGSINITFGASAKVVNGSVPLQYAAPFLSGGNGAGFGNADGIDVTNYLSVGTSSITFTFTEAQKYMGLLWGSVDDYNSIEFFLGGTSLALFDGTDAAAVANGNQGPAGTYYVNFNDLDGVFNKVVFTSTKNSFEFDNVALDTVNRVPDSGATIALVGAALIGLAAFRRRS